MEKPLRIEKMKTAVLVVLFLTTILLLSFFWKNISLEGLPFAIRSMSETTPREVLSVQQVILPQRVEVNFGSGAYTEATWKEKDVWDALIAELALICEGETVLMEEVTGEQFDKVMSYRSIQADFGYSIPFQEMSETYLIKRHQSLEEIQAISSIAFSTGSPESFLLVDGRSGKRYRLVADQPLTGLSTLIDTIEADGFTPYYEASTFFGVKNKTRMPVTLQTSLSRLSYSKEYSSEEPDEIRALAESFFGSSFDFIRKIMESDGSVVYLYGYGQKLFTLNQSGILEYKEEPGAAAGVEKAFFPSLDLALQYLSFHGPALSSDQPLGLSLRSSSRIERGGNTGYRFLFGLELNGEKIFYEGGAPLVVEILGEQVVYFHRDLFQVDLNESETQNREPREAYSIANVLANNYRFLNDSLAAERKLDPESVPSATFENIADRVTAVQFGYLKRLPVKTPEQSLLVPVWSVSIDGIRFYFDLDDATPLGYTVISTEGL